jgi:hypothetical protein
VVYPNGVTVQVHTCDAKALHKTSGYRNATAAVLPPMSSWSLFSMRFTPAPRELSAHNER